MPHCFYFLVNHATGRHFLHVTCGTLHLALKVAPKPRPLERSAAVPVFLQALPLLSDRAPLPL